MVQKVTGFKTHDGQVFDTEALALAHEKGLLLGKAVEAALIKLGVNGAMVYPHAPHDDNSIDLLSFLLDNSEELIAALTPPKKERKPRAPKDPVEPSKPLTEALILTGATTANVVVVTPAASEEAAASAEDELAQLLGGETSATTSAEVAV